MHTVRAGVWEPQPPSKHVSPLPPPPSSNLRLAHVTTASPAKRITFYKSGDSQFGGVRMAVHKRSFKCFDALLDDLSQKVPLPFGVRTVTTPRGIHAIKHLEQLQDGGCYLCSDRRQAKPVNMELSSKRPGIWYHHSRRPQRPETSSAAPPGHLPYRQRRILLVKNSEPGMRRSVVLSRRSTRSLRAFLDEVSEVMQFHVRKLYTAEGRRIDSVQSLVACPGVLVCVGREAFSPLLVNFISKSSEEKLPGLSSRSPGLGPRTPGNGARSPAVQGPRSPPHGAQSRASEYNEGHESKKNGNGVNFGLETKKSIIHPRSDSSNRSTRFSLSSEKSYGNGVSTYSQARPAIMNEDIEKRVLVNKDGSLSVEMRVRFRLQNDETLQWSTQIKKSPSLTNECCPLSQAQPSYLQQGQSESCSDPDSTSFDPECVDYSNQPLQCSLEGNSCPCCYQRQEQKYDLWENPVHSYKRPPVPPPRAPSHTHTMTRHTHSSSSSSSCNSRRVVRCRAQLSSCGGGSGSEQSQLVQEEMCVTQQVERRVEVEQDGDTHVEVCKVSRCCSRNLRPLSRKSVEDELLMEEQGERPFSTVSSSSRVLQSLKEDLDDDLPPSASQCCHSNEPSPSPSFVTDLNDEPASSVLAGSIHSTDHKEGEERGSRAVSAASSCHCGAAEAEEMDQASSSMSKRSRLSCRSSKAKIPNSEEEAVADDEDEELKRVASGLSGHTGLSAGSLQSGPSSVCPNCGGCKRPVDSVSNSRASQRSHHSPRASPKPDTPFSNQENADNNSDDDGSDVSAVSTQSNKTNLSKHGRFSAMSDVPEGRASSAMSTTSNPEATGKGEERAPSAASATSHRSNRSHKSGCNEEERSPSAISAQSNLSAKSRKSHKSKCSSTAEVRTRQEAEGENAVERALSSLSAKSGASVKLSIQFASPTDCEEDDTNQRTPSALSVKSNASVKPDKAERPESVLSAKSAKSTQSNVSAKSGTSRRSTCSHCVRAVSPGDKAAGEPVIEATGLEEGTQAEARTASAMSAKSNLSAKSHKSHKSTKAAERSLSPRLETGGDGEESKANQMSVKSNLSVKFSKSCKSNCHVNETAESPILGAAEVKENEMAEEETQQRPESVTKLENKERAASAGSSKSHKSACNESAGASSETEDNTGGGEKAEDRAASALSGKSASSAKSQHPDCDACSRVASPAEGTGKTEVDSMEDRTHSALSGKSHTSAKSSKSQKSNRTVASPNEEEKQNENQERVSSAMSVKSKSSVRSSTSHKSNSSKNLKSVSPSPNAITIKTSEGVDEEENETTVRAPSAASAKSGKSKVSSASSNHNKTADIAVIETVDADEKVEEDNAPRSKSSEQSGQMLARKSTRSPRTHSPKAPAVSPSGALSVHSTTPAKSGRLKCCCGAASALERAKKEKQGEDKEVEKKEDNDELKSEEASERPASILSSSTKRHRRESGGTEQPLSRNSSGSVSLGLPDDQETPDSDSGKSGVSFHINTDRRSRVNTANLDVPKNIEQSAMDEDEEGTGSSCNGSKSTLSQNPPAIDIPTIETTAGSEDKSEEGGELKTKRAASTFSAKSSRSHKSSCNCSVKAAAQPLDNKSKEQHTSASSTKASNLDAPVNRTSSAMASPSAKVRSKSPASVSSKNANVGEVTVEDSANNYTENQAARRPASKAKGKDDIADNKVDSVLSKSPCCLKPESAASAHSGSKESKGGKAKSSGSVKTSNSQKKETPIKSPSPCSLHSSRPGSKMETDSQSTLFHSLSAADLLKETMAAARPPSQQTTASKTSDKPRSEKSGRHQRRNRNQADLEEVLDLTPAFLPNASPNEVVSDWLRSIPTDSSMLALGDELNDEEEGQEKVAEERHVDEGNEEEVEQEGVVEDKLGEELNEEEVEQEGVVEDKLAEEVPEEEETPKVEEVDKEEEFEAEEEEEKEEQAECDAAEEEKSSDPAPVKAVGASSRPSALLLSGESLPRNWQSSAAVMKVLLSSSLGRCQSMPEVSPVYGRRLSTSARGLLDCLAQLQLIDPAVSPCCEQQKDRNQQYEDIMTILQSLWLTEPKDIEATEVKDIGKDQVTPPRSSSGVDMSTGSGGSGKEDGNKGGDETTQNKTKETDSLHEDEGAEKVVEEEEEGNAEAQHKETKSEPEEISTEQAKTDIAEELVQSEEQSTVPPSLDSPKASDNPSSSDKSSANDSSKSPTDNETLEDSSSGTPPTVLRAPLSKRPSQDPDPRWVLHLLKKLEKQFMNHYINAMAEFKVRWDLDDSLILDTMISELREEVSRRIQSSIEREMRKIQGRAGRGGRSPRPPQGGNLSRESTMTDRRRQMLKIMKNQSVKTGDSLSDGEMTGEFSDQRSDDEYCPCDACVRKKMAARPLKTNPMAAEAPVMMEFDLLKILQLKKSPSPVPADVPQPAKGEDDTVVVDEQGRSLEVLQEEEEEDEPKEDIKADEIGEEVEGGEAGEEEEVGAENEGNRLGDEEQEEEEAGGEEAEVVETSENGEKEGEEETECQCQCARHEEESDKAEESEEGTAEGEDAAETSDKTGEDETAEDEERAGEEEGENAENEGETGDNDGEEECAEVEEFEEEEETTGRESGEEEATGETEDDGAARNEANEESTAVEEFVEGNVSASAEAGDEDDGDDGTGEGESHEDEKGGESEEPQGEASEEERASLQGQGVTEGEEADAEDSDTDKRPSDTSADESGREGAGATGDEEEKQGAGDGDEVVEDAVEEFKPEEEEEGAVKRNSREDGALLHQFTRTSVESQPGSLEEINTDSPQNPVNSTEVPKMAADVSTGGGTGQRRSRSPARVKRRKPKESDVELDHS